MEGKQLTATFEVERETKNTVRFAEVEGDGAPIIGTLYVQKWAVKTMGAKDGQRIKVTLEIEG